MGLRDFMVFPNFPQDGSRPPGVFMGVSMKINIMFSFPHKLYNPFYTRYARRNCSGPALATQLPLLLFSDGCQHDA